jgi:(1->4)-alpha-D-glucan 1-alpha-D-glucosylmutase
MNTTWADPSEEYESQSISFVENILNSTEFTDLFFPFVQCIIKDSLTYSLSQTMIRLTAPGIPDIYQGAECWGLSLVDPDNRSPVDYQKRKEILGDLLAAEKEGSEKMLLVAENRAMEGAQKMLLIRQILLFRRANPGLFTDGDYLGLPCEKGWIAFIRKSGEQEMLVVAPIPVLGGQNSLSCKPEKSTKNENFIIQGNEKYVAPTTSGNWKNLITGKVMNIGDHLEAQRLVKDFPVAALKRIND